MEQEKTLIDNLFAFKEIPSNKFHWLKEDEVREDTLLSHKAKWNDDCRQQYKRSTLVLQFDLLWRLSCFFL